MKRLPQIDRFYTAVCSFSILALFVLLSSCEKDNLQEDYLRIKASNVSTAALVMALDYEAQKNYDEISNCESVCIEEGKDVYYLKSGTKNGGNNSNTKKVSYNAYNTDTQFIVEVLYQITSGSSNATADITITIGSDAKLIEDVSSGTTVSHSLDLSQGWQACEIINFTVLQEALGSPINFSESYSLIGVCSSTCDESFSYEDNGNNSYTFTYVSSEDMEGAEVKFTCPHIVGFEAMDGKQYSVNPGNVKGSPTVLTWIGDIEACTEITFTLLFEADCDQTSSDKVNLFTDFKVNGVSKKGDNENIVFNCSE